MKARRFGIPTLADKWRRARSWRRFDVEAGYIHPTAAIGSPPEARDWRPGDPIYEPILERGVRVSAFVTIDSGVERHTRIGARSWCMAKVHIGHDAQIGEDCELAPMTSVGGYVEIGNGVKVGQGAVFKPRVRVGDGARIGMGAVVTKDVPPGEVWVGNPARQLIKGFGAFPPEERELWRDARQRMTGREAA